MAAAAFNGNGNGLRINNGKAMMATPAVVSGDGGRQRLTAAMDEVGCWCLMVAMDSSCGSSGQ